MDLFENVKQTSDQVKPRLTYPDHHPMFMEERKEINEQNNKSNVIIEPMID